MGKKSKRHGHGAQKKNKPRQHSESSTELLSTTESKKCPHITKAVKLGVLQNHIPHVKLGQCSVCNEAPVEETSICICLRCGKQGCDRYSRDKHGLTHYQDTPSHCITANLHTMMVWCYACDVEIPVVPNTDLHECIKLVLKAMKLDGKSPANKSDSTLIPRLVLHDVTQDQELMAKHYNHHPSHQRVKGLVNLGNTCFFNAVMQNLFQTELLHIAMTCASQDEFSHVISTVNCHLPSLPIHVTSPAGSLTAALAKLLNQTRNSSPGPLNPKHLFAEISKKAPRFRGFQQQDSQELLRYLLDSLKTEQQKRVKIGILNTFGIKAEDGGTVKQLSDEKKKQVREYVQQVSSTVVDSVFGGQLDSIVICHQCHKESRVTETFLDLSLSLTPAQTKSSQASAQHRNAKGTRPADERKVPEQAEVREDTVPNAATKMSKHQRKAAKKAERKKGKANKSRSRKASNSHESEKEKPPSADVSEDEMDTMDKTDDDEKREDPDAEKGQRACVDSKDSSSKTIVPTEEKGQIVNSLVVETKSICPDTNAKEETLLNDSRRVEKEEQDLRAKDTRACLESVDNHVVLDNEKSSYKDGTYCTQRGEETSQEDLDNNSSNHGEEREEKCDNIALCVEKTENMKDGERRRRDYSETYNDEMKVQTSYDDVCTKDRELTNGLPSTISSNISKNNDITDNIKSEDDVMNGAKLDESLQNINDVKRIHKDYGHITSEDKEVSGLEGYDAISSNNGSYAKDSDTGYSSADSPSVGDNNNGDLDETSSDNKSSFTGSEQLDENESDRDSVKEPVSLKCSADEVVQLAGNESNRDSVKEPVSLKCGRDEVVQLAGNESIRESVKQPVSLKCGRDEVVQLTGNESIKESVKGLVALNCSGEVEMPKGSEGHERRHSEEVSKGFSNNNNRNENDLVVLDPAERGKNISESGSLQLTTSRLCEPFKPDLQDCEDCSIHKHSGSDSSGSSTENVPLKTDDSGLATRTNDAKPPTNSNGKEEENLTVYELENGSRKVQSSRNIDENVNMTAANSVTHSQDGQEEENQTLYELQSGSREAHSSTNAEKSIDTNRVKCEKSVATCSQDDQEEKNQTLHELQSGSREGHSSSNADKNVNANAANSGVTSNQNAEEEKNQALHELQNGSTEAHSSSNIDKNVNAKSENSVGTSSIDSENTDTKLEYSNSNLNTGSRILTLCPPYLPTPGESSLQSCLSVFCAPEVLKGTNRFACQECTRRQHGQKDLTRKGNVSSEEGSSSDEGGPSKSSPPKMALVYTEATKQLLLSSTPPVLTLHLKRFQQIAFGLRKVAKQVVFPLVLDLAPFCSKQSKGVIPDAEGRVLYSLIGVVEHSGGMNSGHYTAYIKVKSKPTLDPEHKVTNLAELNDFIDSTWGKGERYSEQGKNRHVEPTGGQWYYVSDTHSMMVQEARVLKSQAYMLFYERLPFAVIAATNE